MFGRQVNTSSGVFAEMCMLITLYVFSFCVNKSPFSKTGKEYARADYRWGISDPTLVALEILTVVGAGPLCCYILKQVANNDPARHYWLVVLSTAEIYGGWVILFLSLRCRPEPSFRSWITFCPEWLTGSPNLNTSNALYLWVYLIVSFF